MYSAPIGLSQATLINLQPFLELVLDRPATVINTKLLVNPNPRYQVSTVDRDGSRTEVKDLQANEVIAVIQRRAILSDKVTLPRRNGGKSVKKDDWMKPGKLASGVRKWTVETDHGTYEWRLDGSLRIALFASNEPNELLAYVTQDPTFTLMVDKRAEGSLDETITAFALLEQDMRIGADMKGAGS